jgi:hypothetical protein
MNRQRTRALAGVLVAVGLAASSAGIAGAAEGHGVTVRAKEATFRKTFSGSGNKKLGTLRLRRSAVLTWRARGRLFQVFEQHGFLLVDTRAHRGHVKIHRGVYRRVRVATRGRWRISIRSR